MKRNRLLGMDFSKIFKADSSRHFFKTHLPCKSFQVLSHSNRNWAPTSLIIFQFLTPPAVLLCCPLLLSLHQAPCHLTKTSWWVLHVCRAENCKWQSSLGERGEDGAEVETQPLPLTEAITPLDPEATHFWVNFGPCDHTSGAEYLFKSHSYAHAHTHTLRLQTPSSLQAGSHYLEIVSVSVFFAEGFLFPGVRQKGQAPGLSVKR